MTRNALSLEDLRGGFNRLAEHEQAASSAAAPAAPRPFMTENRTKLFRTMLFERFSKVEAEHRFDTAMARITEADKFGNGRAEFDQFFTWLKRQPKLAEAKATAPVQEALESTVPLIEGKFTVIFEDGSYKTLRVRRQSDDASFKPGEILVGHLTGSDNSNDYTNIGHVDIRTGQVRIWKKHQGNAQLAEAVKVLTGDQIACAKAYAKMSDHCSFCGQPLTTPQSLDHGYGPRCAEKHGLPWG